MSESVRLDIVVPMYNEREVILDTHRELLRVFEGRPGVEARFIYVDDGSTDDTLERLVPELGDSPHRIVVLSRNFGHQPAVAAGLAESDADFVGIIDADLQDPPAVLAEMLEQAIAGLDVVYGVREKRKESLLKRAAYNGFYRLFRWLSDTDVPLDAGDFCVMRRQVVDTINALPEKLRVLRGLRAWVGFRQDGHRYEREERFAGEPKYTFSKLLKLSFDAIFSFSTLPLKLLLVVGLGCIGLAVLLAMLYVTAYFLSASGAMAVPPGFTTLVLLILFFGGAQLAAFGIVGEYLARNYLEVKGRPSFIISRRLP